MKRLFCVTKKKGKKRKICKDADGKKHFSNKMLAKNLRDSLGGPSMGYYVTPGPDHKLVA